MFKKYDIEQMNSAGFRKKLEQAALPYQGNLSPINNILNALQNPPLSCKSIVFEYDYVDEVYQDEYSVFYSKAFKSYPDRCTRLHFFACDVPKGTRTDFGQYSHSYLGFMVLRPTDLQRVGRTILKPPLSDPDTEFVTCLAPFTAHILGQNFTVKAMPFIQQDTQVGACAQASLWMLSRYMSKRFGIRRFMPSEINAFAKAKLGMGRHLPAENGLNMLQMLEALESMGFSAVAYQKQHIGSYSEHVEPVFPDKDAGGNPVPEGREKQLTAKLADIAYRYIESGLPVVFGTANHAMVGVGHKYASIAAARIAIERIPAFYVNNDNRGCYREMPLFGPSANEYAFDEVDNVIAVTPREATLRGESAEDMARLSVEKFLAAQPDRTQPGTYRDFLSQIRPDFVPWFGQLEYRTFLIESVAFQQDIRAQLKARELDRKVGERLLRLDYPKYIWLTEVSSSTLLNKPDRADRKCLGRVLVDSTAPANTRGVIAMHFADILLLYDRHQGVPEPDFGFYPNSTPFRHKLWEHG